MGKVRQADEAFCLRFFVNAVEMRSRGRPRHADAFADARNIAMFDGVAQDAQFGRCQGVKFTHSLKGDGAGQFKLRDVDGMGRRRPGGKVPEPARVEPSSLAQQIGRRSLVIPRPFECHWPVAPDRG